MNKYLANLDLYKLLKWILYPLVFIGILLNLFYIFENETLEHLLEDFHLLEINLLGFKLAVLFLISIIWTILAYTILKFTKLLRIVKKSREYEAYSYLFFGVVVIFSFLLVLGVLPICMNYLDATISNSGIHQIRHLTYARVFTYFKMFASLLFYGAMFVGGLKLLKTLKLTSEQESLCKRWRIRLFGITVIVSLGLLTMILSNPFRLTGGGLSLAPTYGISDIILVTTVLIPTFIGWFMGAYGSLKLFAYYKIVPGIIYRKAVKRFLLGLGLLFNALIIGQMLGHLRYIWFDVPFSATASILSYLGYILTFWSITEISYGIDDLIALEEDQYE